MASGDSSPAQAVFSRRHSHAVSINRHINTNRHRSAVAAELAAGLTPDAKVVVRFQQVVRSEAQAFAMRGNGIGAPLQISVYQHTLLAR